MSIPLLFVAHFVYGEPLINEDNIYFIGLIEGMRMAAALLVMSLPNYIRMAVRGRKGAILKFTACALVAAMIICWFPLFVYSSIPRMLCRILLPAAAIYLQQWFLRHMTRRNQDAMTIKGRILGYRKYLMHVEKSRIEILMQDNPELFYTVFSYAYVLGVSWKWMVELEDVVFPVRDENKLF